MARIASALFALMMVAAACGGSDTGEAGQGTASAPGTTLRSDALAEDSDPADGSDTVDDNDPASAPETTESPADAARPQGAPDEGGLVTTALWSLPRVPMEDWVQIAVVDVIGTQALLGVEPATADEQLRLLAIADPVNEGGLGFRPFAPEFLVNLGPGPDALQTEAGFSLLDVEVLAEVSAAPERVLVFEGPDAWAGQAEPYQGVLLTIGQGDDFEIDPARRGVFDNLGRPVRLAERDGRLAASFSTPVLEGWADSTGASYSGDDRVSPIADALDGHDVVSAYLYVGDFFATPDILSEEAAAELQDEPFISQPFIAAGIGHTIRDGQAIEVVAYRFLTDESAEAAMVSIENAWTTADSVVARSPIAELAEFQSIERTGPVVTVVVGVPDGRVGAALNMLFSRDVTFAHL